MSQQITRNSAGVHMYSLATYLAGLIRRQEYSRVFDVGWLNNAGER